jgi:CPA2 family monovalent cation:H+ antiporter-2
MRAGAGDCAGAAARSASVAKRGCIVLRLAEARPLSSAGLPALAAIAPFVDAVPGFLRDLALVLCVAAVTTVLFQSLRQPVVLGYLLAGVLVGPHILFVPSADPASLHILSELGVILLLFTLGLEFRLGKLRTLGPTLGFIALLETAVMFLLGLCAAQLLGWEWRECLFAAALLCISSTMLVRRAASELEVSGGVLEIVSGVLVFEDLVAILLLALLTTLVQGAGLDVAGVAAVAGKLALFVAAVLLVGIAVVPRFVRWTIALGRRETILVASLGVCFALALLASRAGYSVALGAFLAGSLVAESGHSERIGRLVQPVLDLFAAVFFVSVGMLIDPSIVARQWPLVLGFTALVIVGKVLGVGLGALLTGSDSGSALRSGLCMAQIGEFSFVIAGLGVASGSVSGTLYPLAVAVSTLTAFVAPQLVRRSDTLAGALERLVPARLSNFGSLYATWIAELRARSTHDSRWRVVRRALRAVLIDALVLFGLIAAGSLLHGRSAHGLLVILGVTLLCVWPALGMVRASRRLGLALAEISLPAGVPGSVDMGAAPRRALTAALQVAVLLVVALPLLALAEPFLPGLTALGILTLLLLMSISMLWRSSTDLQGHLRAGAEIVVEALRRDRTPETRRMDDLRSLLPGLGEITRVVIAEASPAVGRTLAALRLRPASGITVVAVTRGSGRIVLPGGNERIQAGDVLAITGSAAAIARALERLATR